MPLPQHSRCTSSTYNLRHNNIYSGDLMVVLPRGSISDVEQAASGVGSRLSTSDYGVSTTR